MTMTTGAPHLPALTGLRFVAAIVVVAYHLVRFDRWDLAPSVARAAALGPTAVTFFFVLSGFVLSWACVGPDGRVPSALRFAVARVTRLLPVHALACVIVAPVAIGLWRRAGGNDFAAEVALPGVLVALGLQAWHPATALSWNPPAWSLSVEIAFSALFPWLAHRLLPRPWPVLATIAATLLVLAFVPGVVAWVLAPSDFDVGPATHGSLVDAWRFHPLLRLPEFLIGMAGARAVRDSVVVSTRAVVAAGAAVCGGVTLVVVGVLPAVLAHNGLLAVPFAVLVAWGATSTGRGARALGSPTMQLLGESSYALYLLHVPVLYWAVAVAERRGHPRVLDAPGIALLAGFVSVVVAVVAHLAFERPARRVLRGWLAR
jgi:peptidoglycan/LPS O-acetylase OafA/YrhL